MTTQKKKSGATRSSATPPPPLSTSTTAEASTATMMTLQRQREAEAKEYRFRPSSKPHASLGGLPLEGREPTGRASSPSSSPGDNQQSIRGTKKSHGSSSSSFAGQGGDSITMQSVFGVKLKPPESMQRRKAAAKAMAEAQRARETKQYNAVVDSVSFRECKYDRDLAPGDTLWQYLAPKPSYEGWEANGRRRWAFFFFFFFPSLASQPPVLCLSNFGSTIILYPRPTFAFTHHDDGNKIKYTNTHLMNVCQSIESMHNYQSNQCAYAQPNQQRYCQQPQPIGPWESL